MSPSEARTYDGPKQLVTTEDPYSKLKFENYHLSIVEKAKICSIIKGT